MASLTPEEYDYAMSNLDYEKLPNRLRCAVCNKAVVDAMKTECCDTVVCGPCAAKLGHTCPVCEYTGTTGITREDKRTRTTLKAHIKGELQKRNNAAAAAAAAAKEEAEKQAAIEEAVATPVIEELVVDAPQEGQESEDIPEAQNDLIDEVAVEGDAEDPSDDKSDIEIITERPEQQVQTYGFGSISNQDDYHQQQKDDTQFQQSQMPFDAQQMFNNMNMNGFNPMLAMQGMSMPFPMMPNMMGMGMDPSMMFPGGFAGMANMMNGGMMNGNFAMPGMGDMNEHNQYNQYGNRFDNRPFNSNHGRGFGQDFRGRGRGFHRGRGRGGWHQQQQYQQYGQQNFGQQQSYQQDHQNGEHPADVHQENTEVQHERSGEESCHDDTPAAQEAVPKIVHESAHEPAVEDAAPSVEDSHKYDTDQQVPIAAPPVNAPTGPRAMREGLPNSGRYSRPAVQNETPRPESRDQAPPLNAPKGPRRQEDKGEDEPEKRRSDERSRSPRPSSKRHRSRSPRKDYNDEERYAEEKRRRKRDRDHEVDRNSRDYEKKRSRSGTPDDRRHRHRDDKDRRRDKSRDRRRRSRDRDDEDYERRKSKHKSRREDKYDDDFQTESRARPVVEDVSEDIGFKIKGTSSGKNAPARSDPYAEERERMKEQRLQKDAERRHTSNGKRGRGDDNNGDEYAGGSKKRRSRPKAKYEDEIGDHEQERERNRWR